MTVESAGSSLPGIGLALILLLIALAVPQVELPRDTYDYIVVFDITQSMNVEDYEISGRPVSRLAFAREAARRAVRDLPCGSRIGWGAFAEYRTIVLLAPIEVCSSYNDLLATLDRIDGRMRWANASEINKGIYWAMRAARDVGERGAAAESHVSAGSAIDGVRGAEARTNTPSLLFLTDGQEAPPLSGPELPLFEDLRVGEVRGWIMGVGGPVPQRIPKTDEEGRPVGFWRADEVVQRDDSSIRGKSGPPSHEELSELRETHLQDVARRTGLDYMRLATLDSLGKALRDRRFAHTQPAPTQIAWIAASAALLILVSAFAWPIVRRARNP